MAYPTLADVKANLIIASMDTTDDDLLTTLLSAAVSYAEAYQHLPDGFYEANEMPARTQQGVVMLVTFWYESRDGGSGGFFSNSTAAAQQATVAINNLLRLDRDWRV